MKVAPVMRVMAEYPDRFSQVLVHTGQHYDFTMSRVFFQDLDLPEPDFYLQAGSGTHAEQIARVMLAFEPVVEEVGPELIMVVGDVNSTGAVPSSAPSWELAQPTLRRVCDHSTPPCPRR